MPVIIGAIGIVTKGQEISRNNNMKALTRFSTKSSHARNNVHDKESVTI
jgi:hypothetical protein